MKLNEIRPRPGTTHRRKRVGCGPGSGHGKTSCRGHKGHKQRSGYRVKMGFEGGQMPLTRRIPKHGFVRTEKEVYEVVNIDRLSGFDGTAEVTPEVLKSAGLIRGRGRLKILSQGELTKPLAIRAHKFSKKAAEKIARAGGKTIAIS